MRAQKMYDELKKQMLQLDVQNAASEAVNQTLQSSQNSHKQQTGFDHSDQRNTSLYRTSGIRESQGIHTSNGSANGGRYDLPFQGGRKPQYGNIYSQQGIRSRYVLYSPDLLLKAL